MTWTAQPDSSVFVIFEENGIQLWSKSFDKGASGPLDLNITYGNWYWVWVCRKIHDTCPLIVITTKRLEIAPPTLTPLPRPQPPEIKPPLLPELARPGSRSGS